ncbi:MAG: hypothetical protein D6729_00535 [Deltaproteobacteria bacterium]|nr:MAG: hypothetical protein D6729_00535 [Deltaproteobacteria bacterium]
MPERVAAMHVERDFKVLYLDGSERPIVAEVQGAHLRIGVHNEAWRQLPLARLGRIICCGDVRWQADALQCCAEAGIPILFVDGNGWARMLAVGRMAAVLDLGRHLENCIASPAWGERYANWREAQERRLARWVCRALRWPWDGDKVEAIRLRLDQALAETFGDEARARIRWFYPLAATLMAEVLGLAGVPPDLLTGFRGGTPLVKELAALLGWPVRGRILARRDSSWCEGGRRQVVAYWGRELERPVERTARRLACHLWRITP